MTPALPPGPTPDLPALIARAVGLHARRPPGTRVMIGLAGAPGAGKSTLAGELIRALAQALPGKVGHLPMDGYHLADVELARLGLADRKGAPATFDAAGYVAMLRRLRANADAVVYAPAFERDLDQPVAGSIAVEQTVELVLTEGNYLLLDGPWAPVRELLDEIWFVAPDDALRRVRLHARHVAFGRSPEQATDWMAANDDLNAEQVLRTRDRADLVITAG